MAQSLGWVNSKVEGAALKDAHLQDLSYQQAEGAGAGEDGIGSVKSDQVITYVVIGLNLYPRPNMIVLFGFIVSQSGNALRRSFEKTGKAAPSGSGSSAKVGGSNKGTAVQHGQQPGIASGQGNSSTTDAKRPSSGKLSTKVCLLPMLLCGFECLPHPLRNGYSHPIPYRVFTFTAELCLSDKQCDGCTALQCSSWQ